MDDRSQGLNASTAVPRDTLAQPQPPINDVYAKARQMAAAPFDRRVSELTESVKKSLEKDGRIYGENSQQFIQKIGETVKPSFFKDPEITRIGLEVLRLMCDLEAHLRRKEERGVKQAIEKWGEVKKNPSALETIAFDDPGPGVNREKADMQTGSTNVSMVPDWGTRYEREVARRRNERDTHFPTGIGSSSRGGNSAGEHRALRPADRTVDPPQYPQNFNPPRNVPPVSAASRAQPQYQVPESRPTNPSQQQNTGQVPPTSEERSSRRTATGMARAPSQSKPNSREQKRQKGETSNRKDQ